MESELARNSQPRLKHSLAIFFSFFPIPYLFFSLPSPPFVLNFFLPSFLFPFYRLPTAGFNLLSNRTTIGTKKREEELDRWSLCDFDRFWVAELSSKLPNAFDREYFTPVINVYYFIWIYALKICMIVWTAMSKQSLHCCLCNINFDN